MPTKAELVAYANDTLGLGVDGGSMTKADIEAAITDAGYDPTTLGEVPMESEYEDVVEDVTNTSSDASFSTYQEASSYREAEYPPPGRQVEQTRGVPDESGGTVFSANR